MLRDLVGHTVPANINLFKVSCRNTGKCMKYVQS